LFVGLLGFCEGLWGLLLNAKAADMFPARSLGTVMGLIEMGLKLGLMIGPLVGGLLFDLQGNYQAAFIFAMGLVTLAVFCIWALPLTARSTANFQRLALEA
jgi:MFS family permease